MPLDTFQKKALLQQNGFDPEQYDLDENSGEVFRTIGAPTIQPSAAPESSVQLQTDPAQKNVPSGALGVVGKSALKSAFPTALGIGAGALAAAPFTGGASILAAIGAGIGGSMLGEKVQDTVLPSSIKDSYFPNTADVEAHPYANIAGGMIPSAAVFNPVSSIKQLGQAAKIGTRYAQAPRLADAEKAMLQQLGINTGVNAGVAGGMNIYAQNQDDKPFDYTQLALQAGLGSLLNDPYKYAQGKYLGRGPIDPNAVSSVQEAPPYVEPVVPDTRTQPIRKVGATGEGATITPEGEVLNPSVRKAKRGPVAPEQFPEVVGEDYVDIKDEAKVPIKSAQESAIAIEQAKSGTEPSMKEEAYKAALREKAKQEVDAEYAALKDEAKNAVLKNVKSDVIPKPIAETPTGDEVYPDYTGVTEDANIQTKQEALQDAEAQAIERDYERGVRRQEGTVKLSNEDTYQKVEQGSNELINKRGFVRGPEGKPILTPDGKSIAGQIDLGSRTVKTGEIGKRAGDTKTHEVSHGYFNDLLKSSDTRDQQIALKAIEATTGRKFKDAAEYLGLPEAERIAIEEPLAEHLGLSGYGRIKTKFYGAKRQKVKSYVDDVISHAKMKLGLATKDDVLRHFDALLHEDVPYGTRSALKGGEAKVEGVRTGGARSQEESKLNDYEQYQEVQKKFKAAIMAGKELSDPEMQSLWRENEAIKNRNGGMPPKKIESTREQEESKLKDYGDSPREDFELNSNKILRDSKALGLDVNKQYSASQIVGTLKNKIPPAEYDILEKAGLDKYLELNKTVSPKQLNNWVKENGPRVETHSYGMEGKVSEAKKEYDKMTHEWYDNLQQPDRWTLERAYEYDANPSRTPAQKLELAEWPKEKIELAQKYRKLKIQADKERQADTSPRATSAYSTVSPFDTTQPMPEWTSSKSGKNVQRVDVVIPVGKATTSKISYEDYLRQIARVDNEYSRSAYERQVTGANKLDTKQLWQPDNLHENIPNTLGWAMIQYKTGPKGEKIAVIPELQARWAQEKRKYWETYKEEKKRLLDDPAQYGHLDKAEAEKLADKAAHYEAGKGLQYRPGMDHALADNPYRLILKAAIEQARKEGATHIVVSDAETAMMTEGHDAQPNIGTYYKEGEYDIPAIRKMEGLAHLTGKVKVEPSNNYSAETSTGRWVKGDTLHASQEVWDAIRKVAPVSEKNYYVEQEPGMRLNYDKILPNIAEELTGSKGERVSLGEHKNAYGNTRYDGAGGNVKDGKIRENLIFKNTDNTPKTDVSGMLYDIGPISQRLAKESPTLFGKRFQESSKLKDTDIEKPKHPLAFAPFLKSEVDKVRDVGGNTGHYVADKLEKFHAEKSLLGGEYGTSINLAAQDLSKASKDRLSRYRHDIDDKGKSDIVLAPDEKKVNDEITNILKKVREDQNKIGLKVKDGTEYRAGGTKKNGYWSNLLSSDVHYTWKNEPNSEASRNYDKIWLKHAEAKGVKESEAKESLIAYKVALTNPSRGNTSDVKFSALRKAEDRIGLPWELSEKNLDTVAQRYGHRAANDLAFFKHIQNDPKMLAALSIKDQYGKFVENPSEILGGEAPIGGHQNVVKAMESVLGFDKDIDNPKLAAVSRALSSSIMGLGTAARNLASAPIQTLPYLQARQIPLAVRSLFKAKERANKAMLAGSVKFNHSQFESLGDIEYSPNRIINGMNKVGAFLRKYQGRELSDKIEGQVFYSLGEDLAIDNIRLARSGDTEAQRILKLFSKNVEDGGYEKLLKTDYKPTEDDISRLAAAFVDVTRGTYDPRGLPTGAMRGQLAPFLALQRFSIEKSNTIMKNVIGPALDGNLAPLLKYTLGASLTGAAIEQLNELISNKKNQDANLNEVVEAGDAGDKLDKAIGLFQAASYMGIVSDGAKLFSRFVQGKDLKYSNPISYPLYTFASDTLMRNLSQATEALSQGEDKTDVALKLIQAITTQTVQTARYLNNYTFARDEVSRKDKFRDLRIWNELNGKEDIAYTPSNEYENLEAKKFKRTGDVGEAAELLPELITDAIEKAKGNDGAVDPYKLKAEFLKLKQNSYQTMPSMERLPLEFAKYISYLANTQGVEEANKRLMDYVRMNEINKVKSSLVPSI